MNDRPDEIHRAEFTNPGDCAECLRLKQALAEDLEALEPFEDYTRYDIRASDNEIVSTVINMTGEKNITMADFRRAAEAAEQIRKAVGK